MIELDVTLADGSVLHVYDTGPGDRGADLLPVLWHHGTPNTGHPPAPLLDTAAALGLRWVGYDRPGYGGSTPAPDRPVSSAATYAEAVADALDLDRFAVMGHSGGGPHALACAALRPSRVVAAVAVASLAPYGPGGLEPAAYTAGMAASGGCLCGKAPLGCPLTSTVAVKSSACGLASLLVRIPVLPMARKPRSSPRPMLLDEPRRGLVRHSGTAGYPPRSVQVRQGSQRQDPRVHRRLERPLPPLRVDKDRRTSPREGQHRNNFTSAPLGSRDCPFLGGVVSGRSGHH